jgi:phage replication initiation protein
MRTDEIVNSSVALIDALAFSVTPPVKHSYVWLLREMSAFLDLGPIELKGGLFGFRYSARFGDGAGVVAWGGESQNGRVYFSLMGQGCSRIRDWPALAAWLEQHKAVIKRVDCAYDDLEGHRVNIAWAVQQYHGGGFSGAIGRKPAHSTSGDWLDGEASTKGRTLYIGNRANGKVCRVYEKGKQLGDPVSAWTRVEVEWHDQDRYIPYDVLTRPGCYLAGAYPCLAFLDQQQDVIKTVAKAATVAFDSAMEVAKRHMGKLVNLALHVFGGDYFEVVDRLKRPGIPARIAPYSYHVERNPAMLDPAMREAFA